MHTLASIIGLLVAPLAWGASSLAFTVGHRPPSPHDFVLAALVVSSALIMFACSCWAAWTQARLRNVRLIARHEQSLADASIRLRDALLEHGDEAIAVLGYDTKEPFFVGNANALLRAGMEGPDSKRLAGLLDGLLEKGTSFEFCARTPTSDTIAVRGTAIGHRAAVYLRLHGPSEVDLDYRATLDAIPAPVWIRGDDLVLRWANRAFLDAVGAKRLQDVLNTNATLERSEIDLAVAARDGAGCIDARRYTLIDGKRRSLALSLRRLSGSAIAGIATDVTEAVQAEAKLRINTDATSEMLEGIPMAIAVFGEDQHLTGCNDVYRRIWGFGNDWVDSSPTYGEILDRLRETRQLPEQHDFHGWKKSHLQKFVDAEAGSEELWHLPGGRSLRVIARPHLQGGIFLVLEDISEKLRLEASLNLLIQVQTATLDAVGEGVAIFGPDGRLVLHNKIFAKLWHFTAEELAGQPHFTKITRLAEAHVGHDAIWSIVAAGLNSCEPDRCNEWGKSTRADGRIIALAMSRLPNGATMATFSDLTDLGRFESLQTETSYVAA
jgi:PAS domain-containing protein